MLPRVDPVAARESLRRSLIVYLEEVAGGNVSPWQSTFGVPIPCCTPWLAGAALPRLENLLRIARYLNVPISSFYAPWDRRPRT